MMTVLLESAAARRPRRTRWAAASFTAHATLIAAAVALTTQATGDAREPEEPSEPPVFIIPMPQQPAPERVSGQSQARTFDPPPNVQVDVPSIPTFDASVPFSPTPVSAREIFDRPASRETIPPGPGAGGNGVHTRETVDHIASPLAGNEQPRYPSTLQRIGLEGEVLVQFVVDSTGRVERESIRIVQATHSLFGDAVRDWLPRTRYAPAEINGTRVRQLVQQAIGFALKQ